MKAPRQPMSKLCGPYSSVQLPVDLFVLDENLAFLNHVAGEKWHLICDGCHFHAQLEF